MSLNDLPWRVLLAAAVPALAACSSADPEPAPEPAPLVGCDVAKGPPGTQSELVWSHQTIAVSLPEGSPSLCDLDHDGRMEVIVPITQPESFPAWVRVLDAVDGTVRWSTPPGASNYGAPFCLDVDGDGTDDVLISGRSGDVLAYSGKDGTALWSVGKGDEAFLQAGLTYSIVAEGASPSVLFVSKGGWGRDATRDIPGRVMVIDTSGAILHTWYEPEQDEIYTASAVVRGPAGELLVGVGSGGERKRGHLYLLQLDEQTHALEQRARVPSSCETGGFVASPIFGDVDGDGVAELVDLDYCGTVHVVGLDGVPRWTARSEVPFGTANPVLADVNGDGNADVIAAFESFNISRIDETSADPRSEVVALDGPTGAPLWTYRTERWVFSSLSTADFDRDGTPDVLVLEAKPTPANEPQLTVLSGRSGEVLHTAVFGDTASTPVLGDVDGDGHLDAFFTDTPPGGEQTRVVRVEFCGSPHVPATSHSGFRGSPLHDGVQR